MTISRPGFRVLFVEDDVDLRDSLSKYLTMAGYEVTGVGSCLESYAALPNGNFHVAVVDVSLPDQSGFVLAEYLRTNTDLKIIILTALERLEDRLRGYAAGAHNYFVKPVDARELLAAVTSLSQAEDPARTTKNAGDKSGEDWELLRSSWQLLTPTGETIKLTSLELQLLELLALNPGRAVSRNTLLTSIYSRNDEHSGRALDSLVRRLRAKITASGQPLPIRTAHAVGFCFSAPIVLR